LPSLAGRVELNLRDLGMRLDRLEPMFDFGKNNNGSNGDAVNNLAQSPTWVDRPAKSENNAKKYRDPRVRFITKNSQLSQFARYIMAALGHEGRSRVLKLSISFFVIAE